MSKEEIIKSETSKKDSQKPKDPEKERITNKETRKMMKEVIDNQDILKIEVLSLKDDLETTLNTFAESNNNLYNRIEYMMTQSVDLQSRNAAPQQNYISNEGANGFREGPAPGEDAENEVRPAPTNADMSNYITSKEVFNNYQKLLTRRDAELANSKYAHLMEKLCFMREDFIKLCQDMKKSIEELSPEDVLNSFEAYLVDIENMLTATGVTIGSYGKEGDQIDTRHQRIVGVVPTNDPAKNGTIAERLSDGYEYDDHVLVKEKVNVYKVAEPAPSNQETGFRLTPDQ